MKHVVMFSGGAGSWATAKRVAQVHGVKDMVLLFADTRMEDEDLYRFLDEAAANVGAPLVRIADGRNVWELFQDNHCIGNGKVDLCSRELKREPLDRWRDENCKPEETIIYLGIDWTESHRITRIQSRVAPWRYEAPLCQAPYLSKKDVLAWMEQEGVKPPRLYGLGFPHNNCGGFCVKAGQAQFVRLLRTMPERYAWHEAQEEKTREIQRQHGVTPSTVMYHRRGQKPGETRTRVTMREFREDIERQPEMFDRNDWGGCGCAVDA